MSEDVQRSNYFWGCLGSVVYMIASLGIVFANKSLYRKAPYPLTICLVQQLVGLICCFISQVVYNITGKTNALFPAIKNFNRIHFLKSFAPSAFFVGYTGFANNALHYCNISSFTIARSGTLPITYLLTVYALKEIVNVNQKIGAALVFLGFVISGLDSTVVAPFSLMLGIISSFLQATYSVIARVVQMDMDEKGHLITGNYIFSSVLYVLAAFALESPMEMPSLLEGNDWLLLAFSSLCGVMITWGVYTIVFYFNALTYEVLAFFKAGVQTVVAVVVLQDPLTIKLVVSTALILGGSFKYSRKPDDIKDEIAIEDTELQTIENDDIEQIIEPVKGPDTIAVA